MAAAGIALRVPTPNVSVVDLVIQTEKKTFAEEVNEAFREYSRGQGKVTITHTPACHTHSLTPSSVWILAVLCGQQALSLVGMCNCNSSTLELCECCVQMRKVCSLLQSHVEAADSQNAWLVCRATWPSLTCRWCPWTSRRAMSLHPLTHL